MPENYQQEDPEVVRARERARMVKWMRGILAEKPDMAAKKAFMAKVHGTATVHGITLEELMAEDADSGRKE